MPSVSSLCPFAHTRCIDSVTEKDKEAKAITDEALFGSISLDSVKVDKLVQEYLTAQSLKIIPQAPFGDAVSQFVDKDDKHAMETFVLDALREQVKGLLDLQGDNDDEDDEDLDNAIERFREKQEKAFLSGELRRKPRSTRYKPRPTGWDSDLDGDWEDQPAALILSDREEVDEAEKTDAEPAPAAVASRVTGSSSSRAKKAPVVSKPNARATRAPVARSKSTPKGGTEKPPTTKARKPAQAIVEPSDDEDEDVIMIDDDVAPPKSGTSKSMAKAAPKPTKRAPRTAVKAVAQTTRAGASSRETRQTQLSFASQDIIRKPPGSTQAARELSADVISDDDDDDAFEPMALSSRRR